MSSDRKSEIIGKVLSPAVRLWLRSQVDSVEELQFQILGRDRQILRGYIPEIFLSSTRAIYQGLHLREIKLQGENIRINIGQIIKGKPLQLLEPIKVTGEVGLREADLNASLSSSLLSGAFTDLLLMLLELSGHPQPNFILEKYRVSWQKVSLYTDKFVLNGTLADATNNTQSVSIRASLKLVNRQTLFLHPIEMELPDFPSTLTEFEVDLGEDVDLKTLSLENGKLFCCGGLLVRS
jgi:LmeA-like phospholipid-binding